MSRFNSLLTFGFFGFAAALLPGCGSEPSSPSPQVADTIASERIRALVTEIQGKSGFTPPVFGDLVSGIVITDPLARALVTPGQPLSVTVEPIDGFVPMHVLLVSRFEAEFDDTAPFTMDLDIPVDAIGVLSLEALAFDAEWNMAVATEVVVQIDVSASLTAIAFFDDTAFISIDLDPTYQAHVFGSYDDGVKRNLTSSELGTVYESLDPEIATIDAEGMVTGLSDGTATVRATNGPHTATTTVIVGESFGAKAPVTSGDP